MLIIKRDTIEQVLDFPPLIAALRDGFVAFHSGEAWVAPITNIAFPEQHGEMHIKPGYLQSSPEICVKIVTCFYDNPRLGMPTRDGAIVLADRNTGRMKALLADQGLITDMRTAGSSAVAVDALAVDGGISLGIVGAGTQAYWHAAAIACVRPIREVRIWGRDGAKAQHAARRIQSQLGLQARSASLEDTVFTDVVVTATPAQEPILNTQALQPHCLIVAMGADAVGKRELGAVLMHRVRAVIADSIAQCRRYGELQWSDPTSSTIPVYELGALLAGAGSVPHRQGPIVFDSTGVAFQDAVGAEMALRKVEGQQAEKSGV